jgi:hypothetical protein
MKIYAVKSFGVKSLILAFESNPQIISKGGLS